VVVAELAGVAALLVTAFALSFVFVLCRWNECRFVSTGDVGECTVGDVGEAGDASSRVFFFSGAVVSR